MKDVVLDSLDRVIEWISQEDNGFDITSQSKGFIHGRIQHMERSESPQGSNSLVGSTSSYCLVDTPYADLDFKQGDLLAHKRYKYQIQGYQLIEDPDFPNKSLYCKLYLTPWGSN